LFGTITERTANPLAPIDGYPYLASLNSACKNPLVVEYMLILLGSAVYT